MEKMKKIALTGLLTLTSLSFAACGGGKTASKDELTLDKDHVFEEKSLEELLSKVELTRVDHVAVSGDRIYFQGSYYGDTYGVENRFASVKLDGSDPIFFQLNEDDIYYYDDEDYDGEDENEDVILYEGEGSEGQEAVTQDVVEEEAVTEDAVTEDAVIEDLAIEEDLYVDDMENYSYEYTYYQYFSVIDGNFVFLRDDYKETFENDEYITNEDYYIVSYDINGNLIKEEPVEFPSSGDTAYVSGMATTSSGEIYLILNEKQVCHYDSNIELKEQYEISGVEYIQQFYCVGDDIIYIGWDQKEEKDVVYRVKAGTTKPESFSPPSIASWGSTICQGSGKYPIYVANEKEVYGWDLNSNEVTEIMDFIDSDINIGYLEAVYVISESDIIAVYETQDTYETVISEFTKKDPKDIPDKKLLTLGCDYLDYELKNHIIDFNKTNDKYRIQVIDYSDYNTYDDYSAGITRMNNDIAAGKIPDIIEISSGMPINSYLEKGVFADLKKYVEKDNDFTMDDFAPNIVNAYSKNGTWYGLVPRFNIVTYAAKQSLVGDKENWTVEEAMNLWKQYPDASLIEDASKDSILYEGIYCMGDHFIDWDNGSCKFNSDEFISLLEFANQFPEEITYDDDYWDSYWNNYETMYRENRVLMRYMYLSEIREVNTMEQGEVGERITFVGFPTLDGQGSYISPNSIYGISASTANGEGAWEFVKYFISDEYLAGNEYASGLPITMSGLQKKVTDAQSKPYYIGDDGEKIEYDDTYSFNGGEITITPMTEERANEVLTYILSVENVSFYEEEIMKLISEEAESYFSGQKSAKEVADIIQSRAQIYVNEHM